MEADSLIAIRDAVAAGDFGKALSSWQVYAAELTGRAERGELTRSELDGVGRLLDWTRTTTLLMRAHAGELIAQRRAACHVAEIYSGTPGDRP